MKLQRILNQILLVFVITILFDSIILKAEENKEEIAIEILPSDMLFNITNMKPGDWAPRTVTIKNNGMKDFMYQIDVRNDSGEDLFNELLITVEDNTSILYEGKLSQYEKIPARLLTKNAQEQLEITIFFPEHLGNEFQGTQSNFAVLFIAEDQKSEQAKVSVEGMIGGGDSKVGSFLPNTASAIFNFLFFGSILLLIGIVILLYSNWRKVSRNEGSMIQRK